MWGRNCSVQFLSSSSSPVPDEAVPTLMKICVIVMVRDITKYLEFIECIITIANVTKNGLIIYQK